MARIRLAACVSVALMVWSLLNSHVFAGVVLQSGSGKIDRVTDVVIDGSTYNATFHHGATFTGLGGAAIIEFSSDSAATTAINAIMQEIVDASVDVSGYANTQTTNIFMVPFNTAVDAKRAGRTSKSPLTYTLLTNLENQGQGTAIQSENAYLTFQDVSSVPEPSTSVFVVALAAAAGLRRRFAKGRRGLLKR